MNIAEWRKKALSDDVAYLLGLLKRYDTIIHEDGTFTVIMGGDEKTGYRAQVIGRNHLKSMLRREYMEAKRPLKGRKLNMLIEGFLRSMVTVSYESIEGMELPECLVEILP